MRTALLAGALALTAFAGAASAQPAAPGSAPEGEIYAAHGTEPFWTLTFEDGKIIYAAPEDERIEVARPRPTTSRNGVHVYRTPRMTVEISHEGRCNDGMSDFEYPDTVRIRFGRSRTGRALDGCGGGILPPATLGDTNWEIVDIDGIPAEGEAYELMFVGDGTFSGRAGCNRITGSWQQTGRTLTTSGVATTRMACPADFMRTERRFLQLIRGPVQLLYRGGMAASMRGRIDGSDVYVTLRRSPSH